jgi:uncharacterized protein
VKHLRGIPVRLHPGDDLKLSLEKLVRETNIGAACVLSCAGSLRKGSLRFAGRDRETVIEGPLEIVSLSGTLSPDGLHLHAALADREGRVTGGHLREGCEVLTTAEIVVAALPELAFRRRLDPATGHAELVIETIASVVDEALLAP